MSSKVGEFTHPKSLPGMIDHHKLVCSEQDVKPSIFGQVDTSNNSSIDMYYGYVFFTSTIIIIVIITTITIIIIISITIHNSFKHVPYHLAITTSYSNDCRDGRCSPGHNEASVADRWPVHRQFLRPRVEEEILRASVAGSVWLIWLV
jgi:hypothetical protein